MENIIYESIVKYKKCETRLSLTEKRVLLEAKRGLFTKKYKDVGSFMVSDIRVVKDKSCISVSNNILVIETNNRTYKIECSSDFEARELAKEINKLRVGNVFFRATNKINKVSNNVSNTIKSAMYTAALGTTAVATIKKNKKGILKALKSIKNLFFK